MPIPQCRNGRPLSPVLRNTELGQGVDALARIVLAQRNLLRLADRSSELGAPDDRTDDRLWLLSGVLECVGDLGTVNPILLCSRI